MMFRLGRLALALVGAALLSSCADPQIGLVDGVPSPELTSCARQGGSLQSRGRAGTVMCVVPYSDAGKSCSSSRECRGRCLADRLPDGALSSEGQPILGRCQPDDKLFGCFAELEGGKVVKSMCID
jgi:putative hemolysin